MTKLAGLTGFLLNQNLDNFRKNVRPDNENNCRFLIVKLFVKNVPAF